VFLTGPAKPWTVSWSGVQKWDGTRTLEVLGAELDLGVDVPFTLQIRPYYFYSREEAGKFAHTIAILAETAVAKDQLSDGACQ